MSGKVKEKSGNFKMVGENSKNLFRSGKSQGTYVVREKYLKLHLKNTMQHFMLEQHVVCMLSVTLFNRLLRAMYRLFKDTPARQAQYTDLTGKSVSVSKSVL